MRVYKHDPKTDAKQYPIRQDGCFVLGDPKHGSKKHLAVNQVLVRTEREMIDLIMRGHSVRVETESAPSLVRRNLYVDGIRVT